jgi:hypothetical protein
VQAEENIVAGTLPHAMRNIAAELQQLAAKVASPLNHIVRATLSALIATQVQTLHSFRELHKAQVLDTGAWEWLRLLRYTLENGQVRMQCQSQAIMAPCFTYMQLCVTLQIACASLLQSLSV